MTDQAIPQNAGTRRGVTLALVMTPLVLAGCAWFTHLIRPAPDATPCTPRHHSKLHPETQKEHGFPFFRADTSRPVPTVNFQVCDSIAADLNGDGRAEVVAADHIQPGFGYFVNHPEGTKYGMFSKGVHVKFLDGDPSAGIAAADFNDDEIIDIVNSNHPGTVTVRLNETPRGALDLTFPNVESAELNVDLHVAHGKSFGFAEREGGVVSADFNLDGRPDIATANLGKTKHHFRPGDCPEGSPAEASADGSASTTRHNTSVLMNRTVKGSDEMEFAPIAYFPVNGPTIAITSADFNGDELPDLLTADPGTSTVSILTNRTRREPDAPACFTAPMSLPIPKGGLPQGAGPTNTIAVDLNDDGRPDLASANWNTNTVAIWINTTPTSEIGGLPSFSEPQIVATGGTHPLTLRSGDLDGDSLNDLVVFPLSTLSNTAMMVLRNESERGGREPHFEVDAVYEIPHNVENHSFVTYFTGAGFVEDFDLDGEQEIGVIVGRGSILLKAMKPGNDILKYVDPGVPLWTVHPLLPHKSGLVIFDQTDEAPPEAVICREPEYKGDDFCEVARAELGFITTSVFEAGEAHSAAGHKHGEVRSHQAKHAAERLQRLVDTAPPEIRDDVEDVQQHLEEAEGRALEDTSWEGHHVAGSMERVTDYLRQHCGV